MALMAVSASCLQGAGLFLVDIGYAERTTPQGTYLVVQGKDGLVSLDSISDSKKLPAAKVEEIVPALEKAYPDLVGMISVREVYADAGRLAESGKVYVTGQVEHGGVQPAASLGTCIATAKATPFAAVTRIEVIRKEKLHVYDLRKKENADTKLEPGDIVLVPQKRIIGQ